MLSIDARVGHCRHGVEALEVRPGKARLTIQSGTPLCRCDMGDTRLGLSPTNSWRLRGNKSPAVILCLSFFARLELSLSLRLPQMEAGLIAGGLCKVGLSLPQGDDKGWREERHRL